ncbi:MAG: hypothetical protein ABIY56_09580 [Dokdonella sp.]
MLESICPAIAMGTAAEATAKEMLMARMRMLELIFTGDLQEFPLRRLEAQVDTHCGQKMDANLLPNVQERSVRIAESAGGVARLQCFGCPA